MGNVLNALQHDLLFDIESRVRSKLNTIVKELQIGKTDSLQKMSYSICGDPTAMKVYEIESYLINQELSLINSSQLAMLWLATDDGADYIDIDLDELPYDAYDVFNYVYNNVDLYDSENYSEEDFLKLLDRQCWLKTTLEECKISYRKLHDEVINVVEYDDFNVLIPDFVDAIEDVQFYYIYGKGIDNLSFKEYEKHLFYKLISLIEKEDIDRNFFIDLSADYEGFDYYLDSYEFYSLLPPIYFAQKIMETEEFRFPLDFHIGKEIEFISLYSEIIANIADENDEKFNEFTSRILNTTIFDINNYGSDEYNQIVYNNSDQRYDHDLSRFLQYAHTLKNSNEEGTRLWVHASLKKELKDEHSTIRSSIEDFIGKEFPKYENKKYSLNAVKPPVKEKSTFSAVKPHVPFSDLVTTQKNTDNKQEIKQDFSSKKINVKEKNNTWRNSVRNPIRINLATIYEAFIEKPFSFFLMVILTIAIYIFISIEALFVFELFSIVVSLIISLNERNKINKLLLSSDEKSLEEMEKRIRVDNNAFAMYSIIGWTSLVIGLLNLNYYLILSSLMCIYFIGILIRRMAAIAGLSAG